MKTNVASEEFNPNRLAAGFCQDLRSLNPFLRVSALYGGPVELNQQDRTISSLTYKFDSGFENICLTNDALGDFTRCTKITTTR